jgi:glutaminase
MTLYGDVLEEIYHELSPRFGEGVLASYIPELATVDPRQFGMAVFTTRGELFQVGLAEVPFSIQSISKVFTLSLVMSEPTLWERTGREPSGNAFNSLVQLEYENGIPRNPFINAGALVVTDLILEKYGNAKEVVLSFVRRLSEQPHIGYNQTVAASEASVGYRNKALAYFLKSFGNIKGDVESVLDAYFHHCSLQMSCVDLVKSGMYLANKGMPLFSDAPILDARQTKYINSLMLTCGTYDAVGDFAYQVGLPAKSGVGGGILAVMPGEFAVCVWSPGLNSVGNSLLGTEALSRFTTKIGRSIF